MLSEIDKLIAKRTNKIEEARKFSQYTLDTLSKKPIDWDAIFNNIEIIGTNFNEALELCYKTYPVTSSEKSKLETCVELISDEHEEIKEKIIAKIKENVEGGICALPTR